MIRQNTTKFLASLGAFLGGLYAFQNPAPPPICEFCGPPRPGSAIDIYDIADAHDKVEPMEPATCDEMNESAIVDERHGPGLSHWFCPSCDRYTTHEGVDVPAARCRRGRPMTKAKGRRV